MNMSFLALVCLITAGNAAKSVIGEMTIRKTFKGSLIQRRDPNIHGVRGNSSDLKDSCSERISACIPTISIHNVISASLHP